MAETLLFDRARSHIAWNHLLGRAFECRVHVPAVTEDWREHLVRCQTRLRPPTG